MPLGLGSQRASNSGVAWKVVNGNVDCTAIKFGFVANVDCIVHCWSLCEEPDGVAMEWLRYTAFTDLWDGSSLRECLESGMKWKGVEGASRTREAGLS